MLSKNYIANYKLHCTFENAAATISRARTCVASPTDFTSIFKLQYIRAIRNGVAINIYTTCPSISSAYCFLVPIIMATIHVLLQCMLALIRMDRPRDRLQSSIEHLQMSFRSVSWCEVYVSLEKSGSFVPRCMNTWVHGLPHYMNN